MTAEAVAAFDAEAALAADAAAEELLLQEQAEKQAQEEKAARAAAKKAAKKKVGLRLHIAYWPHLDSLTLLCTPLCSASPQNAACLLHPTCFLLCSPAAFGSQNT